MRIRKILMLIVLAAFVALWFFFAQFWNANQVEEIQEENVEVIRILAPYESKLHQKILQDIADEYSREDKNLQFRFEFVPKENIKKELDMRSLAGKENVDVVICDNMLMPELIHMGILKEIPAQGELYGRVRKSQMWSSTKENGKIYGIPFTCDPYVVFYRGDILEENQQEPFSSWEELIQFEMENRKTGVKSIGVAGKRADEAANLYRLMLYSMGGNFYGIDRETGVQAYENLRKMARYNLIDREMMNYTQEDLAREFAGGKINIMINQMSAATILRTSHISFQVKMAKIPEDVAGSVLLTGNNIGLTEDSDPRAWDFICHLVKPDVYERICSEMDTLPVFSDVEYQEKKKVYMQDVMSLLDDARVPETYSSWTKISENIAEGVYEVIEKSQADVKKVAESVQDHVRVAIMSG